jgi:hypothetical protein
MNAMTHHPYELRLMPRGLYEIPDVSGLQLACNEGSVWITLDDDPRDIVLEAGERFCGTEHRRALVYAFHASELVIAPLDVAPASVAAEPMFRTATIATLLHLGPHSALPQAQGR